MKSSAMGPFNHLPTTPSEGLGPSEPLQTTPSEGVGPSRWSPMPGAALSTTLLDPLQWPGACNNPGDPARAPTIWTSQQKTSKSIRVQIFSQRPKGIQGGSKGPLGFPPHLNRKVAVNKPRFLPRARDTKLNLRKGPKKDTKLQVFRTRIQPNESFLTESIDAMPRNA